MTNLEFLRELNLKYKRPKIVNSTNFFSIGSHEDFQKKFPITLIDITTLEDCVIIAKDKLIFFHHVMLKTIESCLAENYSDFDAHTTATCCHGIAILVRELILIVLDLDLYELQKEGQQALDALLRSNSDKTYRCTWWVPEPLLDLARLYILGFAKKIDPERGILTYKTKLKTIHQIGTRFCDKLVDGLQKHYSNLVALQYSHYLRHLPNHISMHGVSLKIWGKYVQSNYLRVDKQGIHYAPALFSMQIVLAYLMLSKAKIACINDVVGENGQIKARLVYLLEGTGSDQIRLLTPSEIQNFQANLEEPVIVFGGCVCANDSEEEIRFSMQPWLFKISSLILACDVWYPQFPRVNNDEEFNSEPIVPEETCIKAVIEKHSRISGVKIENPSLFCLTHIYTASMNQILETLSKKNLEALPFSFIPGAKVSVFSN